MNLMNHIDELLAENYQKTIQTLQSRGDIKRKGYAPDINSQDIDQFLKGLIMHELLMKTLDANDYSAIIIDKEIDSSSRIELLIGPAPVITQIHYIYDKSIVSNYGLITVRTDLPGFKPGVRINRKHLKQYGADFVGSSGLALVCLSSDRSITTSPGDLLADKYTDTTFESQTPETMAACLYEDLKTALSRTNDHDARKRWRDMTDKATFMADLRKRTN